MIGINFSSDFNECMLQAKAAMDKTKNSNHHYFRYYLVKVLANYMFPSWFLHNKAEALLKGMPLLNVSNILGPTVPLSIGDGKTQSFTASVLIEKGCETKNILFTIVSHMDAMKLAIMTQCDQIDIKELMSILETRLNELMM